MRNTRWLVGLVAMLVGIGCATSATPVQLRRVVLYQNGVGLEPNALEAANWMSKAAKQGLLAAQYEYAVMLMRGLGLKDDENKAIPYLQTAAEKGIPGAQNRLAWIHHDGAGGVPAGAIRPYQPRISKPL